MNGEVLKALGKFKEMDCWKGKIKERKEKFLWLNEELNKAFNRNTNLEFQVPNKFSLWYSSGESCYDRDTDTIIIIGRLSVITYLHEYAHALGYNEEMAIEWSREWFRIVFPEKIKKLVRFKDFVVKKGTMPPQEE